jgi:hypothetical protein
MALNRKMPVPVLLALTLGPAIAIGATLWIVTDLIPECSIAEQSRLASPDGTFDLVLFSRSCGDTPPNAQAAIVPHGEALPYDAASFFSAMTEAPVEAQWVSSDAVEVAPADGATILRSDDIVAGIAVTYR